MVSKRLGRGLDALITQSSARPEPVAPDEETTSEGASASESRDARDVVRQLDPQTIEKNRAQPRRDFDPEAIESLRISIERHGVLQPVVVQPKPAGGYELIAGERRLRATLLAGLETIPAIVREFDEERLLEVALIENIQREDLHPIELGLAYRELLDQHEWTQAELAERLGKSRSGIANTLRLLELSDPLRAAVAEGRLTAGHAKVLLSAPEDDRGEWFERLEDEDWSVREFEKRISRGLDWVEEVTVEESTVTASPEPASRPSSPRPPEIEEQEQLIAGWIGSKVHIRPGRRKGSGRMTIDFYSAADFDRLKKALETLRSAPQ